MINNSEKTEIHKYLVAKNLPLDVILEVEDHFITQIESIQYDENKPFEIAFYKTKTFWMRDFQPVRKSLISFGKVPRIVKDIQMTEMKDLLKIAFIVAICFSCISFFVANVVKEEDFSHYLLLTNSVVFIPSFCLIVYYLFSNLKGVLIRSQIYYYNQLLAVFFLSCFLYWLKNLLKVPDVYIYMIYNNLVQSIASNSAFIIAFNIFEDIATNTLGVYLLLFLVYRLRATKRIKKYQIVK